MSLSIGKDRLIDWSDTFCIQSGEQIFHVPVSIFRNESGYFRMLFDNYPFLDGCVCDDIDPMILNLVIDMMVRGSLPPGLSETQYIQVYRVCDRFDCHENARANIMAMCRDSFTPNHENISHVQVYGTIPDIDVMWSRYCRGSTITPDTVDRFLRAGANINHRDEEGLTPLMRVIRESNDDDSLERVNVLVGADADLNAVDRNGMTALMWAIVKPNDDPDPDADAWIRTNNLGIIDVLIHRGADLNVSDEDGTTALMWACIYSNNAQDLELVNVLILGGADLDAREEDGKTALMIACECQDDAGPLEIVNVLIQRGADLDACDENGMTALMHACTRQDDMGLEIVGALIRGGGGRI